MISLTRHERMVILFLIFVLLTGTGLRYLSITFPELNNIVSFLSNDHLSRKIDLNDATYEQIVALPFVGPASAQNILDYREKKGSFRKMEELKQVKGIGKAYYERVMKFFKIRPHVNAQ